jgi:CDP-4-dehydro-6-deoxyglucose reductase
MPYARLTLLPSQQVLSVEEGETILDAALRAGLNLPHSCKGGHCSACRARLVSGAVKYPLGPPLGITAQEEAAGMTLLCQAHAASPDLTVEIREIRPPVAEYHIYSLPCRIEHMHELAPGVMSVSLRLPANEMFNFVAGQYIDIMLPQSRRRSFSIANPPHDARFIDLHIRKVAGGEFTQQLFNGMQEKTLLRIEGPLGQFWFREESQRPALLIGGGTGYAPLRAMLRHLLERGDQRPLHLYWGAQQPADLYEDAMLRELAQRFANFFYTPVLSNAALDASWRGRTGWVHEAAIEDHPRIHEFDVYASGPPVMVEIIRQQFCERGLPADQLFFDSFDFAPDAMQKLRNAAGKS